MTAAFVPAFRHPPVNSPWFDDAAQRPWEPGVYEVQTLTGSGPCRFSFWDGVSWNCTSTMLWEAHEMRQHPTGCTITRWRGIVPPSRLPRFVSETLPEARRRVPALRDLLSGSRAVHVFEVVDCMPGYDLMCSVPLKGDASKPLFIYRRRDPS